MQPTIVDESLLARVRDKAAGNDSDVMQVLALLYQFGEMLKEKILTVPSEQVDGYRGAVVQIRQFLALVQPPVVPEQARGNNYIPE